MGYSKSKPAVASKPWGKAAEGATFNESYPTEFRASGIPDGGNGWWAKADIPASTRLRRVSVGDGSLIRVDSLKELEASGWGAEDSVNYGIGHEKDSSAIFFLNPGTACNHADPTREVAIEYRHIEKDVFELWAVKDVKAGEEMFIDYTAAFAPCKWFDEFHNAAGRYPLSQLGKIVDDMVTTSKSAISVETARQPVSISDGAAVFKQQGTLGKKSVGEPTAVAIPWGHQPDESTFHPDYATEFRESTIPQCGNGWFAKTDIPSGVQMRRVTAAEGSLFGFTEEEFKATGWNPDEAVNYGIGHHKNPQAIYFLKPGTAVNHADPTREASVEYRHSEDGGSYAMELWTTKNIKAGEEMFCDYARDYAPCEWYDKMQNERGNIPLSQIPAIINKMYEPL